MSEFNFQGFTFHGDLLRALLNQSKPPHAEDKNHAVDDDDQQPSDEDRTHDEGVRA